MGTARGVTALAVATLLLPMLLPLPAMPAGAGAGAARARAGWGPASDGLPSTDSYFGVTFADIDLDGLTDIVATTNSSGIKVFRGDGAGRWGALAVQPPPTGGSEVRAGDLDNDGNMDLVSGTIGTTGASNGLHFYKGDGTGNFTEATSGSGLPATGSWKGVALGDVNRDGKLDIAATSGVSIGGGLRVFVGDGAGRFASGSAGLPLTGIRESGVVLADFNNDGNLDVAAGGAAGVDCFLGNGGSGGAMYWTNSSAGLPRDLFTGLAAADVDRDGLKDLLLSSYGTGAGLRAYKNLDQASHWANLSTGLPNSGNFLDLSAGDFDLDGNMDIAAGSSNTVGTGLHVYYGDGTGAWVEDSDGLPAADSYVGNDVGDFDGDGKPDLVFTSFEGKGLKAYRNLLDVPAPRLALEGPLGGVSWSGGSVHLVAWNASGGIPPYTVSLRYSVDSGRSYAYAIASGISQDHDGRGQFCWTVPLLDSTGVRVKVGLRDSRGLAASNSSPSDLEIDSAPPSILSTYPADGANDISNDTQVRVRFSECMNRTLAQAAVSLSGPGAPALSAPIWAGNEVRLQGSGLRAGGLYTVTVAAGARDDSDPGNGLMAPGIFTFNTSALPAPFITLGSPNGGEAWVSGERHDITWIAGGGAGTLSVDLEYSSKGPVGPWTAIASSEANDGAFGWTVPDAASRDCFVRATVRDGSDPPATASDIGDAPFAIKPARRQLSITLVSPNGGEEWAAGTVRDITWSAAGGNGALSISLFYSFQGMGGPWNRIARDGPNDGRYSWPVPETASEDCYVKATATDSYDPPQNASDAGDGPFRITVPKADTQPPKVGILSPADGEVVKGTVQLEASATDDVGVVKLQFLVDGAVVAELRNSTGRTDWDTRAYPDGQHTLTARAWDAAGNAGGSAAVTVTVKNVVPPRPADSGVPPEMLAAIVLVVAIALVAAAVLLFRMRGR